MNVVKKIYTDGRVEEGEWKMGLPELQEFVGGYIEMVPTKVPRRSPIVNEEGVYKDLSVNAVATELLRPETLVLGGIRGNALLVKSR